MSLLDGVASLIKPAVSYLTQNRGLIGDSVKCAEPMVKKVFDDIKNKMKNKDYNDDWASNYEKLEAEVDAKMFLREIHEAMTKDLKLHPHQKEYKNFMKNVVLPALSKSIKYKTGYDSL